MARPASDQLIDVIERGGFSVRKEAHLYYGTERRIPNLPIVDPSLRWNGSAQVQGSGSCSVAWTDPFGASLAPETIGDALAPFGAELQIVDVISAGRYEERVPIGWFRITDVPHAEDGMTYYQGRGVSTGSLVELTLQDRFSAVKKDRFDLPESTSQLASVWTELARLVRMPISETLPDAPIPTRVVYPEDRLEALYDLAKVVDAVPYVTPENAAALRPKEWPEPVWHWRYGPSLDGRPSVVHHMGKSMSAEGVYNRIVVRTAGTQDPQVLYSVEVREGALRTTLEDGSPAPAGRIPYFLSSQYVTTYGQAKEWADRELPRVAQLAAREVPVTIGYNPLVEVGDVALITNTWTGRTTRVRVTEVPQNGFGPMNLTAEVRAA